MNAVNIVKREFSLCFVLGVHVCTSRRKHSPFSVSLTDLWFKRISTLFNFSAQKIIHLITQIVYPLSYLFAVRLGGRRVRLRAEPGESAAPEEGGQSGCGLEDRRGTGLVARRRAGADGILSTRVRHRARRSTVRSERCRPEAHRGLRIAHALTPPF